MVGTSASVDWVALVSLALALKALTFSSEGWIGGRWAGGFSDWPRGVSACEGMASAGAVAFSSMAGAI